MLIADLIRLGRPLVEGGLSAQELLEIITDVKDVRARNFFRNVLVASLPDSGDGEPAVWRLSLVTDFEDDKGETVTRLDERRAVGIPFSLPSGGNPLNPQGRYGVPVYPCWDPHLRAFRASADGVREFLKGRLERTAGLTLSPALLDALCRRVHDVARAELPEAKEKRLGVLVLARCSADEYYHHGRRKGSPTSLGPDPRTPGQFVEPNLDRIAEAVLAARLEEGAEMGERAEGTCSLSGAAGPVVAAYCKAWPWALPTWTCPVPHAGDLGALLEGVSLSTASYRALTVGASVFTRLTKKVRSFIIQEVFAPTTDSRGRQIAQKRSVTDLAAIQGCAFVLPVEDRLLLDQEFQRLFAQRVLNQLEPGRQRGSAAERQLEAVTGFECFLPAEFAQDDFRLTLVYFSGDPSRGDIHLRAYIQDVFPSAASRLQDEATRTAEAGRELFRVVRLSEKSAAYLFGRYKSVPYLLARGYGGAHLWFQLEQALHRRRLELDRVTAHAAARMASLVPNLPHSRYELAEEAVFYLSCRDFLRNCNTGLPPGPEEEPDMATRPWKELIRAFERDPVEAIEFHTAGELGFACGLLLRRFNAWYASVLGRGKDYLRERVLTFGANLGPRDVWIRGVKGIRDTAGKHQKLQLAVELGQLAYYPKEERKQHVGDYARRLGVVLSELERWGTDNLDRSRDEFMTGFWAGYSLQGYDRPQTPKAGSLSSATQG